MASVANIMDPVLQAHHLKINGCTALNPSLDDASVALREAHAVLVLTNLAADDDSADTELLQSAYRAVETLLELGIRNCVVGHEELLKRITRQ